MVEFVGFFFFIMNGLFTFFFWALVLYMIASWLIVFNVISPHHPNARQILGFLEQVTNPILEPFRRFIPPMGGLDLSFLVAILVIQGIQGYLLPAAQASMLRLVGG
jgi:YggT family protein